MFARHNPKNIMIMNRINWLRTALFCLVATTFFSCGGDDEIDVQTQRLCARTWIDEFNMTESDDNVRVTLQLNFTMTGNSCKEYLYYRSGELQPYYKETRYFTWHWTDDSQERIEMDYGAGEIGYFDNVQVREHYLTGILDNRNVTLTDSSYR